MQEIFSDKNERIATLTTSEVFELHNILCNNYEMLPEMEPVSPSGVKNQHMLESAVNRQLIGAGSYYKYSNVFSNCATLVFGLVKNHAFHNGNKRIGFLALLKHLYQNGYVLRAGIKHNEVYELLRSLAANELYYHAKGYYQNFLKINFISSYVKWTDEYSIKYLAHWLRQNTEHKNTKIKRKTIAINDFIRMLKAKELIVNFTGRYLLIQKKQTFLQEILGQKPFKRDFIIKDSKNITLHLVDQIRKEFQLSFQDGVDNSAFYNEEDLLTSEILSYKKIIYQLAKI